MVAREAPMSRPGPAGLRREECEIPEALLALKQTVKHIWCPQISPMSTAIFDGNDDPLSVLLIGEYKFRPDLRLDTMLEFGLNDGAPDFAITFGLRKRI